MEPKRMTARDSIRMCMIVYVCYVCICLDVYLSIYIVDISIIYTSNEQLT